MNGQDLVHLAQIRGPPRGSDGPSVLYHRSIVRYGIDAFTDDIDFKNPTCAERVCRFETDNPVNGVMTKNWCALSTSVISGIDVRSLPVHSSTGYRLHDDDET